MSAQLRGIRRLEQRRGMEENHYLDCRARQHNYNPPVDLRLLDYVSTYDNNLMCPICRCPFVDPVVLMECDHCFCRDCIRQSWNANTTYTPLGPRGDCPSCRSPAKMGARNATSKILVNMTDELLVKCPKADHGCKVEVKRGEVQDHINIYCGYALVECGADDCELPVRRKDTALGCLHFGVSCMSCRKEMQKWRLETHWKSECPDRKVHCELCKSAVFYRDLEEHSRSTCPAISIPCPGAPFGCSNRSKSGQAEVHAKACPLAKLAPVLRLQQARLDEQEAAQKVMSRKLEVLEGGFANISSLLFPQSSETDFEQASPNDDRVQRFQQLFASPTDALHSLDDNESALESASHTNDLGPNTEPYLQPPNAALRSPPSRPAPSPPGPRPTDLPEPFSADLDLQAPTTLPPPDTTGGPYASPLHHLLSMHESLRDELSRISTALSELDGRHSMQILNENLRTREEISYLGAQVGGLQRQVHWLTSTQLQRQQVGRSPTPGSSNVGIEDASAGAGVEAAVSTAATALRGAARMVSVGGGRGEREGMGMRRGPSEEGRTKL